MTFIEKFNQLFPNEEAFMQAVEAMGPMENDYNNISPRGSIPASCVRMAMRMRANAVVREARAGGMALRKKEKTIPKAARGSARVPPPGLGWYACRGRPARG